MADGGQDTGEILGTTAQGAQAGGQIGGGYGALIGGILGFAVGIGASRKRQKARADVAGANALRQDAAILRSFAEQRTLIRQGQVYAATAQSAYANSGADIASSGAQGVRSSVYTQLMDNFLLGEKMIQDQIRANVLDKDAVKNQQSADSILAIFGGGSKVAGSFGGGSYSSAPSTVGATNTGPKT